MQAFILLGGSSRQQRDYAIQVASQNRWLFQQIEKPQWESELHKSSVTSNLQETLILFYISAIETLREAELEKLLSKAEESPHRFVFSTRAYYKIPLQVRAKMHPIRVGEVLPDKFALALQSLMTEPDREKVRKILSDPEVEVEKILHILKDNVWKTENPQVWEAVEKALQMMYKVNKNYLVSILAYLFPPSPLVLTYEKGDKKVYKELSSKLEEMMRKYHLSRFEALETYRALGVVQKKEVAQREPENVSQVKETNLSRWL
jgi:DNA-binding transcriptional ArsR family regulator